MAVCSVTYCTPYLTCLIIYVPIWPQETLEFVTPDIDGIGVFIPLKCNKTEAQKG